jgi:hypothetical protein
MAENDTLLCIHSDPAHLSLLQENGDELLTATKGHEGLHLFASQPVDAIMLEYQLGRGAGEPSKQIGQPHPWLPTSSYSHRTSPAAHQVNHQHNQRHNQQQVDQAAGHMQAETQEPQN